ncbi:hypothetical protein NLU13_9145 [Sarocladium strictum]|uniref:TUG ubiquitin-like domain-containing protein n=1 Tax=Sarocladium strictum TaxID=5046 RepID=A0AA39GBT2_SARSR|nr:hypothetical protein NLU13_9145 [Sarocladium strictum]
MSSHVVVIGTDLRRTTVKVSPGTFLTDVLDKACAHFKLSSSKYTLKHKQKQVDLSVPFRVSGLVAGARLELVQRSQTPSAVQVALEVPLPEGKEIPGRRLIQKFPSDISIWKLLRQFESGTASAGRNINITGRAVAQTAGGSTSGSGQMYYETPVLNIMGRELASFAEFQKTLAQLGYNSGSVLIRLSYRLSGQTLYEAMEEIAQHFKETEEVVGGVNSVKDATAQPAEEQKGTVAPEDTAMTEAAPLTAEPSQSTSADVGAAPIATETSQEPPASSTLPKPSDPYQPVNVFLAPSGTIPAAALAPAPESDFQPTIAHAQLHQARLQESSRNKRLLSDKELAEKAAAEEARLAAVKSLRVRIRFPDNTSSDWEVGPDATGSFLYEAVRRVMASPEQPFHLTLPGAEKTVIKDADAAAHNLVRGYKLAGRVLLSLVWEDTVPAEIRKQPFLKANVARQGQEVKVPDMPTQGEDAEERSGKRPAADEEKPKKTGDGGAKKVPKWFKGLGKK